MKTKEKLNELQKKSQEKYFGNPIITKSVWVAGNIGQIDSSTIKAVYEKPYFFVNAQMKNHTDKIIMLYDNGLWSEKESSRWVCKDCGGIWYGNIITCICENGIYN